MSDPWRYGAQGLSIALKVTPGGGRDAIDGTEILANGRNVLKLRVRAIADGGEANKAVIELLSSVTDVAKARIRILSGATSRQKQVAIDGNAMQLAAALRAAIAAQVKEAS